MRILKMTAELRPGARRLLFPILAITLFLIAVQPLRSQQPAAPTFSSEVKVVNMLATVRDKHGKIVPNLTKDDFTLEEDGKPQTIRYFSEVTDLPLTLGLLVDTSFSQRRLLEQERAASKNFLVQVLREGKDKAFVIHFDKEVELLQDLTSSGQKLEAAPRSSATTAEAIHLTRRRARAGGAITMGPAPCSMTRSTWPRMN
jgi:VWFA-related protein